MTPGKVTISKKLADTHGILFLIILLPHRILCHVLKTGPFFSGPPVRII